MLHILRNVEDGVPYKIIRVFINICFNQISFSKQKTVLRQLFRGRLHYVYVLRSGYGIERGKILRLSNTKPRNCARPLGAGGLEGDRTLDLTNANRMLSQTELQAHYSLYYTPFN